MAAKIRKELTKGGPRLDTWRTAQNEVHLFEPARSPTALADRLLEAGEQPDEMLARYKLDDPLIATGKYMLAAEDAVRARAPQLMRKSGTAGLERVLQIGPPRRSVSSPTLPRPGELCCGVGSTKDPNRTPRFRSRLAGFCYTGSAILDCGPRMGRGR